MHARATASSGQHRHAAAPAHGLPAPRLTSLLRMRSKLPSGKVVRCRSSCRTPSRTAPGASSASMNSLRGRQAAGRQAGQAVRRWERSLSRQETPNNTRLSPPCGATPPPAPAHVARRGFERVVQHAVALRVVDAQAGVRSNQLMQVVEPGGVAMWTLQHTQCNKSVSPCI